MFRKILVPIDFSDVSENALAYAEQLAQAIDATTIEVVHVFTPTTAPDAVTLPPISRLMEERRKLLDETLAQRPPLKKIERKHQQLIGFAAEEIIEISENYDLIVMGSTGDGDLIEQVFGSVSSSVALKAECPVLLVPGSTAFKAFKEIVYTSNNISLSRRSVMQLMDFNDHFNAKVHFVHIAVDDHSNEEQHEKLLAPLLNRSDAKAVFQYVSLAADTIHEGLNQYIDQHPIDLAIIVTKQRGFWARLFHRSATKELAFNLEAPLMVFRLED